MKGFGVSQCPVEGRSLSYLVEPVFPFWTYGISGALAKPFPVGSSVMAKIMSLPTGSGNILLMWNISETSVLPSSLTEIR